MNRLLTLIVVFTAFGCSDAPEPAAAEPKNDVQPEDVATAPSEALDPATAIEVEGFSAYMVDEDPSKGEGMREPIFEIRAEKAFVASSADDEAGGVTNTASMLEGVSGIVFREDAEDLLLKAKEAEYDDTNKTAVLKGDVTINAGELKVQLDAVTWHNADQTLRSNSPVRVQLGNTELTAQSFEVLPKENHMILRDGQGTIQIGDQG